MPYFQTVQKEDTWRQETRTTRLRWSSVRSGPQGKQTQTADEPCTPRYLDIQPHHAGHWSVEWNLHTTPTRVSQHSNIY